MSDFDKNAGVELTPLERQAHAWVRRLTSGDATVADGEAVKTWCKLSPSHAAAFASAADFWQAFGLAGQSLPVADPVSIRQHFQRRQLSRRVLIGGALAAASAGILILRPPLDLWPSFSELRADYRTGTGEQRQVVASSGLSIRMNTRTSLSLVDKATGEMELISGEAAFAAPARRAKPVIIIAAGGRTSTIDARFDVRLRGATACVTCFSDQVDIDYRGQLVRLIAKQQVSYGNGTIGAVATIDPASVLAWQQGLMIFNMTPLSDVIQELNRYRSGFIVLLDPDLGKSPVSGRFRTDRPDESLRQIEQAFGIKSRALPGGFILLG